MITNPKDLENLQRQIANSIRQYERNQEWTDVDNWLYRLSTVLGDKKYPALPHDVVLAKRLAQCLNPAIPSGVHATALKVYNQILVNFPQQETLLPLLAIGLVPFFEACSFTLKFKVMTIFQTFYLPCRQILQMLVSLMNTLVSGLNENNQDLAKRIYAFGQAVSVKYGRLWVDGAVWINILKAPKIRTAGLKYLMKVFKDRDKNRKKQDKAASENEILQEAPFCIPESMQAILSAPDCNMLRFPNFSSLVVSALSACILDTVTGPQNMTVKRSTLDMLTSYLKLENMTLIQSEDAQVLVRSMLRLLVSNEFFLIKRVYTYLFDQPNMDGVYAIDPQAKGYELQILKNTLKSMLTVKSQQQEPVLDIIDVLLRDHPTLIQLILPDISFAIFSYLNANKEQKRNQVNKFIQKVVRVSRDVFLEAVLNRLKQPDHSQIEADQCMKSLELIFEFEVDKTLYRRKSTVAPEGSSSPPNSIVDTNSKDTNKVVQQLIEYLVRTKCHYEAVSIYAAKICKHLIRNDVVELAAPIVSAIDDLIAKSSSRALAATLIELHPGPAKGLLLPYVEEGSFGLVCINSLLQQGHDAHLDPEEQIKLFFSIFRLLNCHLWESQALSFIDSFEQLYDSVFQQQIDLVQPSEWLIYWNRLQGNVAGGVIRMLSNVSHKNPYYKYLSCKWIEQSEEILGKIVQPVFQLIRKRNKDATPLEFIYSLIRQLFQAGREKFTQYFYSLNKQFLGPFINFSLENVKNGTPQEKSASMEAITHLLQEALNLSQVDTLMTVILPQIAIILDCGCQNLDHPSQTLEIEVISLLDKVTEKLQFEMHGGSGIKTNETSLLNDNSQVARTANILISSGILFTIVGNLVKTDLSYVRRLYFGYLLKICTLMSRIGLSQNNLQETIIQIVVSIIEQLRNEDVSTIQQKIQNRQVTVRQKPELPPGQEYQQDIAFEQLAHGASKIDINLEAKYAEILDLWNKIKLFLSLAISAKIKVLPAIELLNLILGSFPFSGLKYFQYDREESSPYMVAASELQAEIKAVTGLRKLVVQIFELLWSHYSEKIMAELSITMDFRILIHCRIEPPSVLKSLANSASFVELARHYKLFKFGLPKTTLFYSKELLAKEVKICYVLYLYLLYCESDKVRTKRPLNFNEELFGILMVLRQSTHTQVKLWLYEILTLVLDKFIPFKDIGQDQRIKQEIIEFWKELHDELVAVCLKLKGHSHQKEVKTAGLLNFIGLGKQVKENSLYDFIEMTPPTIYSISNLQSNPNRKDPNGKRPFHCLSDGSVNVFLSTNKDDLSEEDFKEYLSLAALKTISKVSFGLMNSIYEQDCIRVSLSVITMIIQLKETLLQLLPVCAERSPDRENQTELISHYMRQALEKTQLRPQLLKYLRKNLLELYFTNNFFKCTKVVLEDWKRIIDLCTEDYDLLETLLEKEGLFEGLLTRKAESIRLKIKSFERVCFVIYAGRVDKYENKLRKVLESLSEVMKQDKPSAALLILILFCIRILLMRLSPVNLTKLFKPMWPSIITLLIQIFNGSMGSCNPNLFLAALKVVELVHALELEEFHQYRWLFSFDHFGLCLQPHSQPIANTSVSSPFTFKPYLCEAIPQGLYGCSFIPQKIPSFSSVFPRSLVVRQSSVSSEAELRQIASILMHYMMDLSDKRTEVNKADIEDIMQADFISLDDYIFDVR